MSSETSTDARADGDVAFQPIHFYVLLGMIGATVAVVLSRNTHPAALLLLSAAMLAAGGAAALVHRALAGFFGLTPDVDRPLAASAVSDLEREKALVLRSIKELEFDRAMKKVSDADFADMSGRLRARALSLMDEIERGRQLPVAAKARGKNKAAVSAAGTPAAAVVPATFCAQCGAPADTDAKFCKRCGAKL